MLLYDNGVNNVNFYTNWKDKIINLLELLCNIIKILDIFTLGILLVKGYDLRLMHLYESWHLH